MAAAKDAVEAARARVAEVEGSSDRLAADGEQAAMLEETGRYATALSESLKTVRKEQGAKLEKELAAQKVALQAADDAGMAAQEATLAAEVEVKVNAKREALTAEKLAAIRKVRTEFEASHPADAGAVERQKAEGLAVLRVKVRYRSRAARAAIASPFNFTWNCDSRRWSTRGHWRSTGRRWRRTWLPRKRKRPARRCGSKRRRHGSSRRRSKPWRLRMPPR